MGFKPGVKERGSIDVQSGESEEEETYYLYLFLLPPLSASLTCSHSLYVKTNLQGDHF